MRKSYFQPNTKNLHEDGGVVPAGTAGATPATTVVGTGGIAGTDNNPPVGEKARKKYKKRNSKVEETALRDAIGISGERESGYRNSTASGAPKERFEHIRKMVKGMSNPRHLLGLLEPETE